MDAGTGRSFIPGARRRQLAVKTLQPVTDAFPWFDG
jgi:hypothetical protein